jgi:uncharacterized protein
MIRPLGAADFDWVLALNAAHETETSALDAAKLARMAAQSFRAIAANAADGFLIAFDQASAYDSVNFRWLQRALPRFVYVDRVVVAAPARRRGLARALYEDVFAAARAAGHDRVACEVNAAPPNPGSDAFHARQGFAEIGSARLENGKVVRYLVRNLIETAAS